MLALSLFLSSNSTTWSVVLISILQFSVMHLKQLNHVLIEHLDHMISGVVQKLNLHWNDPKGRMIWKGKEDCNNHIDRVTVCCSQAGRGHCCSQAECCSRAGGGCLQEPRPRLAKCWSPGPNDYFHMPFAPYHFVLSSCIELQCPIRLLRGLKHLLGGAHGSNLEVLG